MASMQNPHKGGAPRAVVVYFAVLAVVAALVAGGATIWLSTGDSGTNILAADERAISRVP